MGTDGDDACNPDAGDGANAATGEDRDELTEVNPRDRGPPERLGRTAQTGEPRRVYEMRDRFPTE
jgi:hypothetical protein